MRFLANSNIDFLRWRWHALALSAVVIAAGLFTVASQGGLALGIDFSGGTATVVRFTQPVPEDDVRAALAGVGGEPVVQQYGPPEANEVLIRLPMLEGAELGANLEADAVAVEAALRQNVGEFELISRDIVGPVIGAELQSKGIWATLTALAGILIYVGFRFRFTFAVGAIIAVFHDLIVALAFLQWFGFELSLNVIAALLTITGYSVNDTIVIFDRVRENQRLLRREPIDNIVNRSVNQTLGRTLITSGTTFVAVLSLFLLGGEVLHSFSFTMIVGVLTGTYSSVFIAVAVALMLSRPRVDQARAQARAKRARV